MFSVCWFVCLSLNKITQKVVDDCLWDFINYVYEDRGSVKNCLRFWDDLLLYLGFTSFSITK